MPQRLGQRVEMRKCKSQHETLAEQEAFRDAVLKAECKACVQPWLCY